MYKWQFRSLLLIVSLGQISALLGNYIGSALLVFFLTNVIYVFSELKHRRGVVHLDLVFFFFFMLYSIAVPLFHWLAVGSIDFDPVIKQAFVCCSIASLGYIAGSYYCSDIFFTKKKHGNRVRHVELDYISGYVLIFLGFALTILAVQLTVGFKTYLSAGYAGRALIKRNAGPIELGLYFIALGITFQYLLALRRNVKFNISSPLVLLVIGYFIYVSFLGVRRPSFLLLLSMLAVYDYYYKNIKISKYIFLGAPLFIFFVTFANYRQVFASEGFIRTVEFIFENANWTWFDLSATELGAPFKSLMDAIEWKRDGYFYGATYMAMPAYIMPSIFGLNVDSISIVYTNTFFSKSFISIGGNMGFFPVAEAFLNFGYLGCFVVFFVYGVFWKKLDFFFKQLDSSRLICLYAILVPWMAFFMRLDFSSYFKGLLYSVIVPFLILSFARILLFNILGRKYLEKNQ